MPAPRILAIRFSSIGDVLLTTPLLRAVRTAHPDAYLALLTRERLTPLVSDNPRLNEVIALGAGQSLGGLAARLRERRFTHVLDLHGSLRSRALRFLVPARWSRYRNHRLAREILIRFHTDLYPRPVPVPERYFDTVRRLGVVPDGGPPEFHLSRSSREEIESWMAGTGLPGGRRWTALAPGAAHQTKQWPAEYWQTLAASLAESGEPVVVVGGPEDAGLGESIAAAAGPLGVNAAGRFGLQGTGALLERCQGLVSGDTGVMHMATGVGTPVLALFGPTVRQFGFFPYTTRARVLELELGCRPCTAHGSARCPLGHHRCLRELSPALVERELAELTR